MRLDLSKEQINAIIDCLNSSVVGLALQTQNEDLKGDIKDIIEEALSVRTATVLYLKDYMLDKC